jgi:hypothetical protein
MSTNQPAAGSAISKVLSILSETNGYVTLGIEAAGVIIPLVKGLVGEIRKIGGGTETEQYQILITADLAELDDVAKLAIDDLAAINDELTRLGKPTVALPSEGSDGPAADPAPGSNSLT